MWGCHHESERDGKGKGGTKAGDRKKREREGRDNRMLHRHVRYGPFRLTRLHFPTPYSRNVSTRLALGGPSPCPVIPSLLALRPDT